MKINVARELRFIGDKNSAHFTENIENIEYYGRLVEFAAPADIDVEYSCDGESVRVWGRFVSKLKSECALCLKEFVEPFEFEFDESFVTAKRDEDDEAYLFEGDVIDISTMIIDNILINMPLRSVCSQDCKGLCPICGCNLNYTQCSCDTGESNNEQHNPLSLLGQLLTDGEEV